MVVTAIVAIVHRFKLWPIIIHGIDSKVLYTLFAFVT